MTYFKVILCTVAVAVQGQSSPPPAPPAPNDESAFGCWFYLPRACDQGRDSWRSIGWHHDTWGINNNASDNEYRCEQERVHDWNNYCFVDSPGVKSPFAFRSGILNPSYAISSNLYLLSNHTAIVDGYDITSVSYINASMYPQSGNLIVRSNTLTVANADIGGYSRHHGAVYVSGGTFHVTGGMRIGNDGFGELRQTGGTVTVDGTVDAARTATSTSLIHQTGGSMTFGTLNLGSTASHAHLLVKGTASVGYLTLRDDYSTISTGSHKTRIVVGSGGVLTVTEQLSIPTIHDQIELRGGQLVIGKFWQTNVETDLTKTFLTMYRDSSLLIYTSNANNNNPCDSSGNLGTWYVNNLLDPAYPSQANKNFRPVLGEDSGSYQILTRCTANSDSATGYAMEAYVYQIPSPPPPPYSPPPIQPPFLCTSSCAPSDAYVCADEKFSACGNIMGLNEGVPGQSSSLVLISGSDTLMCNCAHCSLNCHVNPTLGFHCRCIYSEIPYPQPGWLSWFDQNDNRVTSLVDVTQFYQLNAPPAPPSSVNTCDTSCPTQSSYVCATLYSYCNTLLFNARGQGSSIQLIAGSDSYFCNCAQCSLNCFENANLGYHCRCQDGSISYPTTGWMSWFDQNGNSVIDISSTTAFRVT